MRTQQPVSNAMQAIVDASLLVANGGFVSRENICSMNDASCFEVASGEQVFDLILTEARKAKRQILIQTFGWSRHAKFAKDFNLMLQQLGHERAGLPPLKVFILANQLGRLAQLMFRKTLHYRPLHEPADIGLENIPDNIEVHFGVYHHNSFGAQHAKTVIIDDEVGIITGANFQTTFYGDRAYHDAAVLVKGQVLKAFHQDFCAMWQLRSNKNRHRDVSPDVYASAEFHEAKQSAVMFASSKPHATALAKILKLQSPLKNPVITSMLAAIDNAEQCLRIAMPNLGTSLVVDALARFVNLKQGRIELVMTKRFNNEREKFYGGTNAANIKRLIDKIDVDKRHLVDMRWYCKNEKDQALEQTGTMHMKLMIIDDALVVTGSANLDQLSFYNAREANLVIDNKEFAIRVRDELFTPVFNNSVRVNVDVIESTKMKLNHHL